MTKKEAKEYLKMGQLIIQCAKLETEDSYEKNGNEEANDFLDKIIEAMDVGADAVDKEIKKSPLKGKTNKETIFVCPSCRMLIARNERRCWKCGQAIDWGND